MWSVLAGLLGARVYHVLTDYHRFQGHWLDAEKVWEGGLGIPGGLLAGVLTGVVIVLGVGAFPLLSSLTSSLPVDPGGPGDRRVGQLVQPEALRPPVDPSLGGPHRQTMAPPDSSTS